MALQQLFQRVLHLHVDGHEDEVALVDDAFPSDEVFVLVRHAFTPCVETLADLVGILVEVFEELVVILLSGQHILLLLCLRLILLLLLALRNDAASTIRSAGDLRHFALFEALLEFCEALDLCEDVHVRLAQDFGQNKPFVEG